MMKVARNEIELFPETNQMPLYWANLLAKEKIRINPGGTYSGKTHSLVRVCLTLAVAQFWPQGIIICSGTLTRLREDAIAIFESLYDRNRALRSCIKSYNRTEHKVYFNNGTTLKFTSYENSLQAEGAKCDILYICEAPRLTWDIAYRLIFRTNYVVFIDYNPSRNFWADDKIINCKVNPRNGLREFDSVKVFRSWHIHNHFISKAKHEEIESITDPDMYKVYARGLKGKLKGQIFTMTPMKLADVPKGLDFGFGIDFGYNHDKCAVVKTWFSDKDRNRYHKLLLYKSENEILTHIQDNKLNISPANFISKVLRENGCTSSSLVWGDHDKNYSLQLRKNKVPFRMARKGPNSLKTSISAVRKFNNFTVDSPELDEELKTYTWETAVDLLTGDEITTDQPVDGMPDDAIAAVRYFTYSHSQRFSQPDND